MLPKGMASIWLKINIRQDFEDNTTIYKRCFAKFNHGLHKRFPINIFEQLLAKEKKINFFQLKNHHGQWGYVLFYSVATFFFWQTASLSLF